MDQPYAANPLAGDENIDGYPGRAFAHRPLRPGWDCQACGQQWPCRQGQADLLIQYAEDRVGLLVYLAGLLVDAVQDVPEPPHLLLERFLCWAKL